MMSQSESDSSLTHVVDIAVCPDEGISQNPLGSEAVTVEGEHPQVAFAIQRDHVVLVADGIGLSSDGQNKVWRLRATGQFIL